MEKRKQQSMHGLQAQRLQGKMREKSYKLEEIVGKQKIRDLTDRSTGRETIEHACSWNEQAQKNHYLMEQIADFIKQLYEYYYLEKNEIKKNAKKYIS